MFGGNATLPGATSMRLSESEIFIRSFQTQETSAKTITGRCRRGHLEYRWSVASESNTSTLH